jgi:hypothetical protein
MTRPSAQRLVDGTTTGWVKAPAAPVSGARPSSVNFWRYPTSAVSGDSAVMAEEQMNTRMPRFRLRVTISRRPSRYRWRCTSSALVPHPISLMPKATVSTVEWFETAIPLSRGLQRQAELLASAGCPVEAAAVREEYLEILGRLNVRRPDPGTTG